MDKKTQEFLEKLADLLEKYEAGLGYSKGDDGIWATVGNDDICVGFIDGDDAASVVRAIIPSNPSRQGIPNGNESEV